MNRNSLLETAGRSFHQIVRLTLNKAINDNPFMQEMGFQGMAGGAGGDARQVVERMQSFGFSSVPLGPSGGDQSGGGQAGGGAKSIEGRAAGGGSGGGGGGQGGQQESAEGIAVFAGGQRNHPIVIAVDDRRHRPMGLKPGENSQYDDIQQMTLMRRDGLYLLSNDNEDGEGKKADRMVSLRHVEKDKQERQKQQGDQSGQGGAKSVSGRAAQRPQAPDQSQFKHEGKTVNTEVRVNKQRIEFRTGENVKGYHDKNSDHWQWDSKTHNLNGSDNVNIGNKQVKISGSSGVAV